MKIGDYVICTFRKDEEHIIRKVIATATMEGRNFISADGGPPCSCCGKTQGTPTGLIIESYFKLAEDKNDE